MEIKKINVGIFGGSFDPIHIGHLKLAQAAIENRVVDEILFVPAAQAPMRDASARASTADRLRMLEIALEKFSYPYKIDTCEIERGEISYAIDTAKELAKKYPNKKFKWIIGADHIAKLSSWKNIEELSKIVSFACAQRIGFDSDTSLLPKELKLEFFDFTPIPHSSTQIRKDLSDGKKNLFMLDANVEEYILKHKLYNT